MPSIGQSNAGGVEALKDTGLLPTESLDKKNIERGYSGKLSHSRIDDSGGNKIQTQHRLDAPKSVVAFAGSDKTKIFNDILSQEKDVPLVTSDDLVNIKDKKGLGSDNKGSQIRAQQGLKQLERALGDNIDVSKKKELLKLISTPPTGDSEGQTTSLSAKETTDKAWGKIWESINSQDDVGSIKNVDANAPEQVNKFTNEQKEQIKVAQKVFNLTFDKDGFADTSIKVNALTGGPKELVDEIKSDFKKLSLAFNRGDDLFDTDMLATMLSNIQEKMQTNRLKFDQENIKINQVNKEILSKKTIGKIKDAIEEVKKAKEAKKVANIFQWIGLAITVVVTVALFATGVGAVAGALLIAALALQVTLIVDQHTGNHIMKELTKGIQDLFNVDEEDARLIATALIMAITIALSLGAGAAGGAASGASRLATLTSKFSSIIGGAAAIGEGAATITSGVHNYKASNLQADSKELRAKTLRIQQMIEDATESLQNALEDLQAGHSRIAAIINDNDDTKKQISKNLKGG